MQHAGLPCPSPTPGVHPDSRPSSQWCHPAISSSVGPFSSCPQFFPASESFPMSQLFTWGGQSTGVSALTSFLPKKSQGWSYLLIFLWNHLVSKLIDLIWLVWDYKTIVIAIDNIYDTTPWRRKWQPTLVLLPGKFCGWKSLVGYSPWGHKELDTIEWLHFHFLSWYSWNIKWIYCEMDIGLQWMHSEYEDRRH